MRRALAVAGGVAFSACLAVGQQAETDVPAPLLQRLPGLEIPLVRSGPVPGGRACDASRRLALIDVNADGHLDLVFGADFYRRPRLLLGDGHGRFDEVTFTHMPDVRATAWQISSGDIDGDGDVDLVMPAENSITHCVVILANDGSGRFTDESWRIPLPQPPFLGHVYSYSHAALLADFDGDGDLDVVLSDHIGRALYQYSGALYLNDGQGNFQHTAGAFPRDSGHRSCTHGHWYACDIDLDGDADILGVAFTGGIACWINDGSGNFTDGTLTRFPSSTLQSIYYCCAVGDVDGDGDVDVIANRKYVGDASPSLYLNDGHGHFVEAPATSIPAGLPTAVALKFIDFDQDGDLDLFHAAPPRPYIGYPGADQILLNDGSGRFTLDTEERFLVHFPNGSVPDAVAADLDRDGDLELILPDGGYSSRAPCRTRYYSNTTRHIHAPEPPQRGTPWQLIVQGRLGSRVVVAVSTGVATTPLPPWGTLWVDPNHTIVWPAFLPIGPSRARRVAIPIPQLAALLGVPLHAQALIQPPTGVARLTNLWFGGTIR